MKSVVESIARERFGCAAFRGDLAFELVTDAAAVGIDQHHHRPRALVSHKLFAANTEEKETSSVYQVYVPCSPTEHNRFVFQYAHEVAHFYLTPYCHAFLEVCAVAVSLSVLSACAGEWTRLGKMPASYASKFASYRLRVTEEQPRNGDDAAATREVLNGAMLASQVLDVYPSWRPLMTLCQCLVDEHLVDFDAWMEMEAASSTNDDDDIRFVQRVIELFASQFGHRNKNKLQ